VPDLVYVIAVMALIAASWKSWHGTAGCAKHVVFAGLIADADLPALYVFAKSL